MARVAILIDADFEDSEYVQPVQELKNAGHTTVTIGLEGGKFLRGKKAGTKVSTDLGINDAKVYDYDALLIPGGYSPDRLRAHPEPVAFTRDFFLSGKPVFAICHGPQLLISADVLKGRKATGYRSIAQDLINAGAQYVDEELVIDGNLITSRHPGDLPAFCEACLKLI